jgi:hypothetical protein
MSGGLGDRGTPRRLVRFGRSPAIHCGPGLIVAFAWLSEQPAEAHDLGGRRRDREPHGLTNSQIP